MKTKGTGNREQGTGENKTFSNPRLVLMNLCYATTSVWNVYDAISVMASKNRLILTSKERRAISCITSDLLNCYVELGNMVHKRMSVVAENAIVRDKAMSEK